MVRDRKNNDLCKAAAGERDHLQYITRALTSFSDRWILLLLFCQQQQQQQLETAVSTANTSQDVLSPGDVDIIRDIIICLHLRC